MSPCSQGLINFDDLQDSSLPSTTENKYLFSFSDYKFSQNISWNSSLPSDKLADCDMISMCWLYKLIQYNCWICFIGKTVCQLGVQRNISKWLSTVWNPSDGNIYIHSIKISESVGKQNHILSEKLIQWTDFSFYMFYSCLAREVAHTQTMAITVAGEVLPGLLTVIPWIWPVALPTYKKMCHFLQWAMIEGKI